MSSSHIQLLYIETSIPPGLTAAEYRRNRPARPNRWQRLKQLAGGCAAVAAVAAR